MPIYSYSAKRGPGKPVSGEIEAPTQENALEKIEEMGMIPVKIEEKGQAQKAAKRPAPEKKPVFIDRNQVHSVTPGLKAKVKSGALDTFTRQLASLVKSNVPMLQALALLAKQTEDKTLKGIVFDLGKQIKDGKMLSEAMSVYPKIFNNMYLSMIRSGERSGTLDEVLYRLAEHREREQELRHKIQAALAYPVLVIVVGVGTIFVMLTYFLPKLTVIFKGMKQELPLPTKILMGITDFMSAYWYLPAIVCIFLVFMHPRSGSRKKVLFDMIKMHIPFLYKFTRDAEIARFAKSLAILLKNGLAVHESLELAASSIDNEAMKESIARAGRDIIDHGMSLSTSFAKTNIFPEFTINMISVGEESGRVTEALDEIANVYEREVNQTIKIMSALMEPVLILIVGAVVGFIVFAMLMPVFNIGLAGR
ncbi:MAG: type II secretion system F family protein [Candidatus Omnitrophica bacterium]|nr:type II secretion system F family protein [Candidatus Omnitrophota bacterium]